MLIDSGRQTLNLCRSTPACETVSREQGNYVAAHRSRRIESPGSAAPLTPSRASPNWNLTPRSQRRASFRAASKVHSSGGPSRRMLGQLCQSARTGKVMNKAFVREPDDSGAAHCPRCGSLGVPVGQAALAEHLPEQALRELPEVAFFCPFPTCDAAYFDSFERSVGVERLNRPVYPKDPDAPICSCFGLTTDDIDQDITEGSATRTRALLEKAKTPAARCAQLAADGQCCVQEVQRYFMRRRAAR